MMIYIFINDLHLASELFMCLFADNTGYLASRKNLKEFIKFCNTELQKIAKWFSSNLIAFNVKKCKYIFLTTNGKTKFRRGIG